MTRSESQREADKRYAKKISGKYKPFIVNLSPEELEYMNSVIANAGMKKSDFLRWAIEQLKQQNL